MQSASPLCHPGPLVLQILGPGPSDLQISNILLKIQEQLFIYLRLCFICNFLKDLLSPSTFLTNNPDVLEGIQLTYFHKPTCQVG